MYISRKIMTTNKNTMITRAISKSESEVTWLIGVKVFVGVGVSVEVEDDGVGEGRNGMFAETFIVCGLLQALVTPSNYQGARRREAFRPTCPIIA